MSSLYFFLVLSFVAMLIDSIKKYKKEKTKENLFFIIVKALGVLLCSYFFLDAYLK